ncbi:Putative membrane protein ydgH [uncultured Clostridium sp.]|uniref:efflux RND transporter permease subunit n=1 Tax=uncultured Clostridium sp. TaxID=59620 RepID=UPI000821573C|nr:MMPL family transporter [uncultured Clostridium sp.]SCJ06873.1 Putative membrane protein ydgH [uncultured Clostridium sp.]
MKKLSQIIAKNRVVILVLAFILLIPSAFGYFNTKVNYDILSYLPSDLETRQAQAILKEQFGCGSLAMLIVDDMDNKDVEKLKGKVEEVQGVNEVIWINDALDISVPMEILPSSVKDMLFSDNSTLMIVKLSESDADIDTQKAVQEIRDITGKQAFLSGIAGVIKDTKDLADKEAPVYILIAVILSLIVLALTMESFLTPVIFLLSIGIAIAYNMGTNIWFGDISYITKALSAVLQLGVTMDYSIFLLHRYDEERLIQNDNTSAMAVAIEKTIGSIAGSSLTTIAGFLALCIMELALGKDIGFVMAKGVVFGLICTVTVLPALILVFDKGIHRFKHKTVLPKFEKSSAWVIKHHKVLVLIGALILIPALIGYKKTDVYYNLDESLPKDLPSIVANNKLKTEYNMMSTNIILVKEELDAYKVNEMIKELKGVDGVTSVIGFEDILGARIPESFIPDELLSKIKNGGYEEIMLNSEYKAASEDVTTQLKEINNIVKKYDPEGLVGGEAPLTNDLINIADTDFKMVSFASIIAIFLIILIIFKSPVIPIILVLAIELAIYINLGVPYYMGTSIPFIASIVIGTIQLGATVDYAILLTSRFKEELAKNKDKNEAMRISLQGSTRSIVTSALTFFGATAGVGIISDMEMISSLCTLMARGAIISMFVILFILPGILLLCEKIIVKTSKNFVECVEGGK